MNQDRIHEGIKAGSDLARRLFDDLFALSADPPGVTRVSYGKGERDAFALVANAAKAWNAALAFDPAGNQFITIRGRDPSCTMYVGSHFDTVPHGGNFDGAAGVLLGLALQAALVRLDRMPPFDLVVLCLRAEESCWFPHSYIGSKSALGLLDAAFLHTARRSDSGRTLAEHMREEGFDPKAVAAGGSIIDRSRTVAFIEPHIEQGPVLVAENRPLGLVTGIRGGFRFREARCYGAYAHSGATPRRFRKDAVVATAELVERMQLVWNELEAAGHDLAVTFGILGTDPAQHSFSKVAGETRFSVDLRSASAPSLELAARTFAALSEEVAAKHRVRFDLGPVSRSEPAVMSDRLLHQMSDAARASGFEPMVMASGAGHDAATFAAAGIPAGMIFIRNANDSHNPDEQMEMSDFDCALSLLISLIGQAERWS